jgi:membrane protease subunit (stomatin/prohibitin family)
MTRDEREASAALQTPGSASSVKPRYRGFREYSASQYSEHGPGTDSSSPLSLKTESHLLGDTLREMLQARMEVCGIKIVSFELSDLAYAAEVAPMMLARQQAAALVDARDTIVAGAVRIVNGAVRRLAELGHCSSAGDRARLATNMMTVLAGQTCPQPIISLSDAEFTPKREG